MRLQQFRVLSPVVLRVVLFGLLAYMLGIKLQISSGRYFDADELAYLHFAHNVFIGERPYYDFLSNVPTIFWYVLAPLYYFVDGVDILSAARLFGFVVQTGIALTLGILGTVWRGFRVGIIAAGIFLFLPIPSDKLLEVRPDNLAILLALISMVLHVRGLQGRATPIGWFTAGVLYGLSLIVLAKTVPQVIVATFVTLLWWSGQKRERTPSLRGFLIGIVMPLAGFVGLHIAQARSAQEINVLIYTLTKFPFEVNGIAGQFVMQPDLFFYPNTVYYGTPGWSSGLIVNHSIWFVGLMVGVIRLLTPFIPYGRKGALVEVLVAGTAVAYPIAFVLFFTFRHAQYLIPSAMFVALFAADGVIYSWNALGKNTFVRGALAGCMLVLTVWLGHVFISVNAPKLSWTNAEDKRILAHALGTIPRGAYVFDLVGATIYFKDPYYVCCVPFGQWEPYLSRALPDLAGALETTGTQYVYQGRLGRAGTLSERDQAHIRAHFSPLSGDSSFLVRNK